MLWQVFVFVAVQVLSKCVKYREELRYQPKEREIKRKFQGGPLQSFSYLSLIGKIIELL